MLCTLCSWKLHIYIQQCQWKSVHTALHQNVNTLLVCKVSGQVFPIMVNCNVLLYCTTGSIEEAGCGVILRSTSKEGGEGVHICWEKLIQATPHFTVVYHCTYCSALVEADAYWKEQYWSIIRRSIRPDPSNTYNITGNPSIIKNAKQKTLSGW